MESIGPILQIGKNLWEATTKWFRYIKALDANMQNLQRKMEDLSSQECDINIELSSSALQQRRKRPKKEVEDWLRDVLILKSEVQKLDQEVVRERKCISRARLGKLVMKKIQEVEELQTKGRFSNGLLIDALSTTNGQFIPTTKFFGETTSVRNKEKVWRYLMDDEVVRKIGLFGMGGVGKTTIMHHINNELLSKEHSNFDGVIWVIVSKAFNIRKVQDEIAKALNLDLSNYENETRRASELYSVLSQKKRYVLILDDLWEAFPMEKVGIPEPTRDNGCKLVLTTRSYEVCRRMECETVKVELLTEQEALNLFMSKVEDHKTLLAPEVKSIARKIAEECACLPLAIITIAGSMRGVNDIHEWRNALNELTILTKHIRDDESEVFERLKFSYSRLKDETLQHCFLYCALYPEDHSIPRKELIEYWIAEGLIAKMSSRGAMFDRGHTILNKLIYTCLLESSTKYEEEGVRMHDLIRDMALKISTRSPRFMVHSGEGMEDVPLEDWSEDLERISLIYNKIEVLPFRPPICPRLTTLLLKGNPFSVIPDSFFLHMHCLKVLDLSRTNIKSLPESISNLESLHALLLGYCKALEYVPSLEKLNELKELKLNCCNIKDVPRGIEELVNLRTLDLSKNLDLQTFPSWKLCRLSQLQYLRIDATKVEVSAEEVLCLRKLKVVSVQFHNVQELISYLTSQHCQGLETYRLTVGFCRTIKREMDGKEVWINDSELVASAAEPLVPPSNIESLEIVRCHGLKSLSHFPSLRDARDLVHCYLQACDGMEFIFSLSSSVVEDSQIPLRSVEMLRIYDLPNLRVLFEGVVPPYSDISFNLKTLVISGCSSIKNIFPAKLLHNLPNLEELEVSKCEQLENIIVEAEISEREGHNDHQNGSNRITLPNFRHLSLFCLPRLQSIHKGIMVCESPLRISVWECPMLRRLPLSLHMDCLQASAPPALPEITGDKEWWESLEWDDPLTKNLVWWL